MKDTKQEIDKSRAGIIIKDNDTAGKMAVEIQDRSPAEECLNCPVQIYYDWCKKCGICVSFCPTGALGSKPDGSPCVPYPDKCIHCEKCDALCPDFAITGAKREEN